MTILLLSSLIATILLVWFKSDAVVEYGKLFSLSRWLKLKEYEEKRLSESFELSYPLFLRITHEGFIFKLITCPICLAFWLAVIASLFIIPHFLPIVYILSLFIYGIIIRLLNI